MKSIKSGIIYILSKLDIQEIGEDTVKLFMLQMITLIISFLPSILISRTLGPEMKGRYDLFSLLNSYISDFGLLGFGAGLLFYQMTKEYHLSTIHGTGLLFSVIMAVILSGVGCITVELWSGTFAGLPMNFIILAFILSPFLLYKLLMGNILLGMNKAIVSYIFSLILGMSDAVIVLLLYICRQLSYSAIIYLVSIENVIFSIAGILYIFLHSERRFNFDFSLFKCALKYGIVTYIGTMANSILFKIDLLFLNYYKGNEMVGIYSVAVRWAEMLFLMDSAISAATIYKIGSLDMKEAKVLTLHTMKLQAIVSGTMGVGMLLAAYPLILLVYGKAYIQAALPLVILLPGIASWSVGKVVSQYIVYKLGKAKWCTCAAIIGAAFNIILNFIFIPRFNLNGAALASTFSYIMVMGIILVLGLKRERIKRGRHDI